LDWASARADPSARATHRRAADGGGAAQIGAAKAEERARFDQVRESINLGANKRATAELGFATKHK